MVEAGDNPLQPKAGGHNYMVAVDGSEASELAFTIAMKGLFRPDKDIFNVCTITNQAKTDLPFQYKPDYIEEKYQSRIWKNAQAGSAKFIKKEIEEEKSTRETLWMVAQAYQADTLVVGMHGRKGPKVDFTVAGTAVSFLAQQPVTVAILKDTNMHAIKESYRFGVLFDGSTISENALKKTATMAAAHDTVTAITVVEQGVNEGAIRKRVDELIPERTIDCVVLHPEANQTIKAAIKNYLVSQAEDDRYVDFISVGNRGLNNQGQAAGGGDDYMGSVARAMVCMRKLNVIFIP